jgi:hypothetical protein
VPMSTRERAAIGGRARAAKLTAEQRKESSSRAHLASCVARVVASAPELNADQTAQLRAIFAPASQEATLR